MSIQKKQPMAAFFIGLYQIFLTIMVIIKINLLNILNVLDCARI